MIRTASLIISIGLLVLPGCFNRSGSGPFGNSTRVAAPGTYNLRIPSLANNQPYYTPGQNLQGSNPVTPNPVINPSAPAPTIADRNLNGWKLVGGQPIVSGGQPSVSNAPSYRSPHVISNRGLAPQSNYQVASGTTLTTPMVTGSGNSIANQNGVPNSGRIDSTRMAAIDASGVRPPVSASPTSMNQPSILPAGSAATPRHYFGQLQSNPPINPAPINSNGFTQPQFQNRYAAQPGGVPGSYQSPYIRQGGYSGSFNAPGNPTGWVARDSNASSR